GMHAKRGLSDRTKVLALKLFDGYNNHISTKILLKVEEPYSKAVGFDKPSFFSVLHCASYFGIVEIVASLAGVEGCDINRGDCAGNAPLVWAAWNGHEEVVEMLLARDDVNPEQPDDDGRTPLWCAAFNGHEGVVKLLLGRS